MVHYGFFSYLEFADSLVQNISPGTKMGYNRNFKEKKKCKNKIGLSSAKSKYKLFEQMHLHQWRTK